ncbi:hypothetical protein DBIPINDM_006910 [Mesorhizobium sp. AR02]|uniref:hypothetical protein n=1 Tax=Mesorhizobium sp. AR02 TaxID=2865837 RepID=UPI00215E2E28|nr:hypothetical protein [Mesorhizobium sp. AR02]UVK53418.1 hypothetical protein DBIPINDM_006910 [Mesorhizobium sp. AR02]
MNTYIANNQHDRLVTALAAIEPSLISGKIERDQVVEILMAHEIWPESVKDDSVELVSDAA